MKTGCYSQTTEVSVYLLYLRACLKYPLLPEIRSLKFKLRVIVF